MIRVLASVFTFAFVVALTFTLAELIRGLRRRIIAEAQAKVERLSLGIEPERVWILTIIGTLGGGVVLGLLSGFNLLMVIVGVAAGAFLPQLYVPYLEKQRLKNFDGQLVDAIILVANSLRSGMNLVQALEMVTREMGPPIRQEFAYALRDNRMGKPLAQAFEDMKKRVGSEDLALTVNAMNIAQETGGQLSEVFLRLATSIRERNRIRGRIETFTAQGRLQGIVMSLMPWVLGGAMFLVDREFMLPLFTTLVGQLILVGVVVLEVLGWFLISRVVAIDV